MESQGRKEGGKNYWGKSWPKFFLTDGNYKSADPRNSANAKLNIDKPTHINHIAETQLLIKEKIVKQVEEKMYIQKSTYKNGSRLLVRICTSQKNMRTQ